MTRDQPLALCLYFDECYTEVARAVGYAGTTYRQLTEMIGELGKRFGKARVESAAYHLVTFEGQMTMNPKPLAKVELRGHVRKLCWQLLGPPPEHPCHDLWHQPDRLPLPWDLPQEPAREEKPKRPRKAKAT